MEYDINAHPSWKLLRLSNAQFDRRSPIDNAIRISQVLSKGFLNKIERLSTVAE